MGRSEYRHCSHVSVGLILAVFTQATGRSIDPYKLTGSKSLLPLDRYHSARWGGWQFQLHSRDDINHTLTFSCTTLAANGTILAENIACPENGAGVVHGGWQEARGADIGPQYTRKSLNNSYFVENIFEEMDTFGEFYYDQENHRLYLIPPK